MEKRNKMRIEFDSRSCNESFARVVVAAFVSQLNPNLEELEDIKTAVSEAVTNAIIHGYEKEVKTIILSCEYEERKIHIEVTDKGKGIEDIARAMEPLFTTKPEEDRSGMGFSFMEAFMDEIFVESTPGKGTVVSMWKTIEDKERSSHGQYPADHTVPAGE